MASRLVMKNTFWELEMSPEELEFTVRQHRQRAYTDGCEYGSSFKSTDLGSPRSTAMGSSPASSRGSQAGDASDRWADLYDSDDDLQSQPTASFSSRASSPASRPAGTWSSPPLLPSRPAGTWFLPETMVGYGSSLKSNVATESFTTARDGRTTLIVKNLPAGCSQDELRRVLDEVGLGGWYNFVYVPFDFKKNVVFRYGFVNFEQHEQAAKAMTMLNGFSGWVVDNEKGCEVEWSGQQSLHALIERYRNSPVMHCSVPTGYKPLLFQSGARIAFPAPTKVVNPPKHMSAAQTPEVSSQSLQANEEADKLEAPAGDSRTTLIVKNLPAECTHDQLSRILDEVGLSGLYNFIYVPYDFKKSVVLRYGFVNFEQNEQAVKAMAILDGLAVDGEKTCEVEWGDAQQSLRANIERYRNSPLMHSSVPDAYKPVLFMRGVRIAFPAPTKAVKPLKLRRTQ